MHCKALWNKWMRSTLWELPLLKITWGNIRNLPSGIQSSDQWKKYKNGEFGPFIYKADFSVYGQNVLFVPELVAFIPDCCVIALVCLTSSLFQCCEFLTFFSLPLPPFPQLFLFFLQFRNRVPLPQLERRSLRSMSWETSRSARCGWIGTWRSWRRGAHLWLVCQLWARSPWTCSGSMSVSKRLEV